jgi:hypothetical protein
MSKKESVKHNKLFHKLADIAQAIGSAPNDLLNDLNMLQGKSKVRKQRKSANKPKSRKSESSTGVAASYSNRMVTAEPTITQSGHGKNKSCRIKHRELIDVTIPGSTSWTVQNEVQIQPALAASFPWLAPQAKMWEQYRAHLVRFIYIPIASTGTQGEVLLTPIYDASDPVPTTEQQMADAAGTVVDSCWKTIVMDCDVNAMMGLGPRKYTRQCLVAGDLKTFDCGSVFLSTNNQTGTSAVGKLYVEYDFEFFCPQNEPSMATVPLYTSYLSPTALAITNDTPAILLWTVAQTQFDPLGFATVYSAGVFTPPAGCYRISATACFNDSSNEAFTANLTFLKNNAPLYAGGHQQVNQISFTADGASPDTQINCDAVVALNGTDTFSVEALLIGAAGTLGISNASGSLIVSLA